MAFDFEPSIILETAPQLLGGMKLTLIITLGGLLVGLLPGTGNALTGAGCRTMTQLIEPIAAVFRVGIGIIVAIHKKEHILILAAKISQ